MGKRILICRDDKIGDLIVSLPVIRSLRKSFPESYLGMLVSHQTAELVKNHPELDEIITCSPQGENQGPAALWELAGRIRKSRYQTALILFPSVRSSLACLLAGIPERIGPASKITQITFSKRIPQHRSRCLKHEAEYNLELASLLGAQPTLNYVLPSDPAAEKRVDEFWKAHNLSSKTVVAVHPGSGGSSFNWPFDRYAELIRKLDMEVLVTYGAQEKKTISGSLKAPFLRYDKSEYGLLELAALYKKCAVLVSGSTGPMHIAAAGGCATVSLFCPIFVCRPKRWGPLGNKQRIILPEVPACISCVKEKCCYYPCMEKIPVNQVLVAVSDLLGGKTG